MRTTRKRNALQVALQGDGTRKRVLAEHTDPDNPRVKVSLAPVNFLRRPDIPMTTREQSDDTVDYFTSGAELMKKLGIAPAELPPADADDDDVIAEGVQAWGRLQRSPSLADWRIIGRALGVGRRQCLDALRITDGRGNRQYPTQYNAWLKANGFDSISATARKSALMLDTHWDQIEEWLEKLLPDKRARLNHAQSTYRAWQLRDRKPKRQGETWRNRQALTELQVVQAIAAVKQTLSSKDPRKIAMACLRAAGFAVPRPVVSRRRSNGVVELRTA